MPPFIVTSPEPVASSYLSVPPVITNVPVYIGNFPHFCKSKLAFTFPSRNFIVPEAEICLHSSTVSIENTPDVFIILYLSS